MDRRLQSPTDAIGVTRLEEMSEPETPSTQETPTQDANEAACKREVAAMRVRMPRIQRIRFASVGT